MCLTNLPHPLARLQRFNTSRNAEVSKASSSARAHRVQSLPGLYSLPRYRKVRQEGQQAQRMYAPCPAAGWLLPPRPPAAGPPGAALAAWRACTLRLAAVRSPPAVSPAAWHTGRAGRQPWPRRPPARAGQLSSAAQAHLTQHCNSLCRLSLPNTRNPSFVWQRAPPTPNHGKQG